MRLIGTLLFVVITPAFLSAQGRQKGGAYYEDLRSFKKYSIAFPENTVHIHLAHLSFIHVMDSRADTAAIGFSQKNLNKAFLATIESLRNNAEQFINDYASTVGNGYGDTVLMVIRKFWISDKLDQAGELERLNNIVDASVFRSGIVVKIEFYLQKDAGYFPLYRYDSLVAGDFRRRDYQASLIRQALCASLEKMSALEEGDFAGITRHKKLSWNDVQEFSQRGAWLPILCDTARNPGVYMSFEEFAGNHPSQKKFTLRRDYLTDVLYLEDSSGKEYPTRNAWGYCLDNQLFIHSAGLFFRLQRINDAFYFYGVKNLNHIEMNLRHNNASPDAPEMILPRLGADVALFNTITQKNYKLVRRPFQLDLENGKTY